MVLVRLVLICAHHQVDLIDWGLDQNLLITEYRYLDEIPDPVYGIQVLVDCLILLVVLLDLWNSMGR